MRYLSRFLAIFGLVTMVYLSLAYSQSRLSPASAEISATDIFPVGASTPQNSDSEQLKASAHLSTKSSITAADCDVDFCLNVGESLTFQITCSVISGNPAGAIITCKMLNGPPGATFSGTNGESGQPATGTFVWNNAKPGGISSVQFQAAFLVCPPRTNCTVQPPATVTIKVNHPPVADAGADQKGIKPEESVTLDGSGSSDEDDDPLTYLWSQSSGPSVTLDNPSTATPTFAAPSVDEETILKFKLIVNDGRKDSEPDETQVTINSECGCPHVDGAEPSLQAGVKERCVRYPPPLLSHFLTMTSISRQRI